MSNLVDIEDFVRVYRVGERSQEAFRFLEATTREQALRVLRGHWEAAIVKAHEIETRDNLDYLLAAYSLLEILAHFTGGLPELPGELTEKAGFILGHPAARHYYEHNYPLVLPQLLRDRLADRLPNAYRESAPGPGDEAAAALAGVLALDRRRLTDDDLEVFLSLLDGYTYKRQYLSAWLRRIADSQQVKAELQQDAGREPGAKASALITVVRGLDAFLRYAEDLLDLLERERGRPAGALLWLYHGYFYGESAESVQVTFVRVRRLLNDLAEGEAQQAIAAERARQISATLDLLADRDPWLAPAAEVGLGPYLATLDPPRD